MQRPDLRGGRVSRAAVVIVLSTVLSIILQWWMGRAIYETYEVQRETLHVAIRDNRLPDGVSSWSELGADGTQRRRLPILTAEAICDLTGISLKNAHFAQDSFLLWLEFLLVYRFLRRWVAPAYAIIGMLHLAAVGFLTYLFWYFHPWDRMSQVVWLVGLMAVADRRPFVVGLATVLGMAVKEDIVMLPVLYAIVSVDPFAKPRRSLRRLGPGIALVLTGLLTRQALQLLYPAQERSRFTLASIAELLERNRAQLVEGYFVTWTPLLFWILPLTLVAVGLRRLDWFHRGCFLWVLLCLAISAMVVPGGLQEVRMQLAFSFAVLPGALITLGRILGDVEA